MFTFGSQLKIAVLGMMVLGFSLAFVLTGWQAIDDFRGATVDAEVVGITTDAPGRRVYDVRLTTRSGLTCVTEVDSGSDPPPRDIHLGGPARVHYLASHPCADFTAREPTSLPPWPFTVGSALVVAGSLVGLRQVLRPDR
ncbi:hypothetical protein BJY16_005716 [Actinoplanes octamycinicus]|uniref:Uncharacterized protein n=1 Tax=Actinoplanes octamycinicus TaxID=135948 RepID=A0A7W7H1P7_9ACTN|nr:hypothetical protein [Actinoplanes octamycinicus]MBB4742257.1 hypothetical protein [Actinoplanes octamycinicus]GIE59898.1 hypothetical protein Aoc01nite_53000 [Actinoplanes octamycinicus]